jgi:dynein heavy chain
VYDYFVNPKTAKFQPWVELVSDVEYNSTMPMSKMFVPTAETSSLRFFLDMMVEGHKPIMFVGGAGVGKTQLVKGKLATLPEDMMSMSISFNHFTDVLSFQKVGEVAAVLHAPCHSASSVLRPCLHLQHAAQCASCTTIPLLVIA